MNRDYGKITEETLLIRSRKPVPDRFAGKVAIVTGGSTGIGEAIVEELCREGASVAFTGRTVPTGKTTERRLLDAGFDVIFVAGDMIEEEFCREVVDKTVGKWGKVNYLVNNAFRFIDKGADATEQDWYNVLFTGPVAYGRMIANCAPHMARQGGGAVVNISSVSAHIAQPNRWTYNAAKGAVHMLTKCAALDYASDNIRINDVSPGTIWTRETLRGVWEAPPEERERFFKELNRRQMMQRCGESVEVAGTVLAMLSDDTSFITGHEVMVDGGYINMGPQGVKETALIQDGENKQ
ncbi:MAG: SDR family oxidoreductase [Synergistaceae bacterium]|jgi:NAD(P)-dependent dehydrogenase (short-subunit alcohol dehydrogenase family)|nr:SDR family oxidoreductase [Synergistaceae bacterium]